MPLRISTGAALLPSVSVRPRALMAGADDAAALALALALDAGAGLSPSGRGDDPGARGLV
jgi:hypothetical protein